MFSSYHLSNIQISFFNFKLMTSKKTFGNYERYFLYEILVLIKVKS